MRLGRACESLQAFVIGVEHGGYGPRFVDLDPMGLGRCIGTTKFSFTYRYLFAIHLAIAYPVEAPKSLRVSVEGETEEDSLRGNVVVLKKGDEDICGLTDFDIKVIKDNITMLTDNRGCFLRLTNVTRGCRPMVLADA